MTPAIATRTWMGTEYDIPEAAYDDAYATLARNLIDADEVGELLQLLAESAGALAHLLRNTEAKSLPFGNATRLQDLSRRLDGISSSVEREISEAVKCGIYERGESLAWDREAAA